MAEETNEEQHAQKHAGGSHGHGGGGGHEEAHEGAPEWLISFADNVTLMMGFFVILLAMSMKDPKGGSGPKDAVAKNEPSAELLDAAIAIREAFHNPVDINSTAANDLPLVRRLRERSGENRTAGLPGYEHDVSAIRRSDYYGLGGTLAFEQDAATLGDAAKENIAKLIEHLRGRRSIIEVRGHVSAAEAFGQADRGMQLSYERAFNVARALNEGGIGWEQLRLIACADNDRAVETAYDQRGHAENQRVEVQATDRAAMPASQPVGEH